MKSVDESDFDAALEAAEGLVLVDFWADWCAPCRVVGPVLEGLAPEYAGRVDFLKVNSDENRRLSGAFRVRSLPTVLVLKPNADGPGAEVVGYAIGAKPPDAYRKLLDGVLKPRPSLFQRLKGAFGGNGQQAEPDAAEPRAAEVDDS